MQTSSTIKIQTNESQVVDAHNLTNMWITIKQMKS